MLTKRFVAVCGTLAWLTASAWAGTIQDPAAWIDQGSGSSPFYGAGAFPIPADGIIALYNATGNLLTSITLSTTVNSGLSSADFQCGDLSAGFFLGCTVNYNSTTGALTMAFAGVY